VQANPAPGCSATPAQLEANKKVAMQFFLTMGADRVALADTSYKQHNPVFKQRAAQNKVSDYEEFKTAFLAQPARMAQRQAQGQGQGPGQAQGQGQGQGQRRRQGMGGQMQPGNPFEIVTAECDVVTLVHKMNRPDPAAAGKTYEFFTFDTFRVKNGKLVEHWDGSMLGPGPGGQGGPGGQQGGPGGQAGRGGQGAPGGGPQ